ncbi:spermidine synthase [Vandammella animalimorsus]|uniref:Spermidine synthase n=1 Tax=Vandammella animalimorsus TaxID=2029117 RepID=A0A2A2AVE1_9BURK|nr:fused MFS/spermidine synthase [Vandammella animalimorsus]PAT41701.1 spermidine synthase [Vandammella animalimorsus]
MQKSGHSLGQYHGKKLLMGIFILSGFAGLIYQSVWSQYLGIFLGHAAYAQALVLAIFMGGMAAGAMWIARAGERWRNLVRSYALIEALIGVLGLVFHFVFTTVTNASYAWIIPAAGSAWLADAFRWLIATILIVPQTILLGMTFPLMSGGLIRRFPRQDGHVLGSLYFTNSIGAAIGALAAAFVLLPWVGLPGSITAAGLLNLLVAALAWWVARDPEPAPTSVNRATPSPDANTSATGATASPDWMLLRLVLFCTALSGAASFVYEIVWIRMLGLAVGSTLHAFELMLASFIAGIAFGGLWIRQRADQHPVPLRLAGWMQIGMGLAALFSLLIYGNAFEWVGWLLRGLGKTPNGYHLYTLGTGLVSILIMLPAAFFAGTTLPLFTVALLRARQGERVIGQVYAWNTVGSIAGVFLAMHVLIPAMGLKLALVTAAFVDMGIGVFLLRRHAERKVDFLHTALAGLAVTLATALVVTQVHFDPLKLAGGVFRSGNVALPNDTQMLYYRDGKTASVSVRVAEGNAIAIATNGKVDAAINMLDDTPPRSDEPTMVLLAALPLATHPDPREVGVIGFGSGMTTHTLLGDKRVQRVDTIEIEEAMVAGAKAFGHRVARAYEDPRSHVVIDDAKSYFSGQQAKYDIIISEPSNPWISGIGALFAKEFYEFVPRHLKSGGLFVQWVQLYEIDDRLVSSIMNALTPAFSDYRAYLSNSSDLIIIATPEGTLPELEPERVLNGPLGKDLKRQELASSAQLKFRQVADARLLRAQGSLYGASANSYYYPYLSLEAPKTRFMGVEAVSLSSLGHTSPMLLEALGIREPMPDSQKAANFNLFPGEVHVRLARAYVEVLRKKEGGSQHVKNASMEPAYLLKTLGEQICEKNVSETVAELMARNLRSLADITLPFLTVDMQEGVLISPQWISCPIRDESTELNAALSLLQAMAERKWSAAKNLGEQWLRNDGRESFWKIHFDDLALSAILLANAREKNWPALLEAEKYYGANIASQGEYLISRMLLIAMATNEKNR